MPPVSADGSLKAFIEDLCRKNQVMVFSKTTCPYCVKVKNLFQSLNIGFMAFELNKEANGPAIQTTLAEMTGQRTVPNVFINGQHIGGCDDTLNLHSKNELIGLLSSAASKSAYEYDLIVIGGGSGGLAASKEAASLGKKVAVLDFVKPTPKGTTWGLGGTCVNVGCIPKKLMHQAALLGHSFEDSRKFGWEIQMDISHNWNVLREAIQDHISSLNWNFKVQLKSKNVTYVNAFAEFVDPHTVKMTKKGAVTEMTADHFILATGMRPHYLDIPGAKEFCITSDDLFSLTYCPGKTLVVGASYVSLECSGFLAALGLEVTVMVRSILLRGFDQQMAEMVGEYMQKNGIQFIRGAVPTMIEQLQTGEPGNLRVTAKTTGGQVIVSEYNTVILAIGRDACTKELNLAKVGVKLNPKNGKVITDEEQSSVPNIYAVGDVVDGKPELTPVAIQAGQLLAKRLYGNSEILCDYVNVPTTVFTPLEYGAIGFSEEAAKEKFGMNDIEVYHTNFQPLEWTVAKREENACYAKLICQKSKQEKVIGFHILGPNAGEITQGYAVALKLGATKADFDSTIGIHPTCSEILTTLDITKSSGKPSLKSGC